MQYPAKAAIGAAALLASFGAYKYATYEHVPTVYLHGSENVPHDVEHAAMINGEVKLANYCTYNPNLWDLIYSDSSDIVGSMRENSYTCTYKSDSFSAIKIIGGNNECNEIPDAYPKGIFITNGCDYGMAMDYYWPADSLSTAMAGFADFLFNLQLKRMETDLPPLSQNALRGLLNDSSNVDEWKEGNWYGEHINVSEALKLALKKPQYTPGIIPIINSLLLF